METRTEDKRKREEMEGEKEATTVWSVLPEGCVSDILSLTTPRDTCSLAAVSSVFRSVADSDVVWGRLLPPDYKDILSRAVSPVEFSSKKELFFRLCHPLLIDGGNKSFMLEKSTGKKCWMLSARELSIVWVNDTLYWAWSPHPDSRFFEVAVLLCVCWLEIIGRLKAAELSPNTTYVAYLIFKLTENTRGLGCPNQKTWIFVGPDQHSTETVCLDKREATNMTENTRILNFSHLTGNPQHQNLFTEANHSAYVREDGWFEVVMGEFFNEAGNEDEVGMKLSEIAGGHWKTGLVVEGIELRPKK